MRRACRSSLVGACGRVAAGLALAASGLAVTAQAPPADPREQVLAAERSFAKSMADRDLRAFATHVADEAVFFGRETLRGKAQVVAGWSGFFADKDAPFSWEPDQVEVLASGTLALSTGPVRDPAGRPIARFNSIWRLEAPGVWRVVFDKGGPHTPPPPPTSPSP